MKVIETRLPEVKIIEPKVFRDERGFFIESYNERAFNEAIGKKVEFVQDNLSCSKKNTLRGLHYQVRHVQAKLVRVLQGEIFDVAVDVRRLSPTFGQWTAVYLKAESHQMLWIPEGYAHGFLALADETLVSYKTSEYYDQSAERCLKWDLPELGIPWPLQEAPLISPKDLQGLNLSQIEYI